VVCLLMLGLCALPVRAGVEAQAALLPVGDEPIALTPYIQQVIVQKSTSQDVHAIAKAISEGGWYRRDGRLAADFSVESQWFTFSVRSDSPRRHVMYAELAAPDIDSLEWFVYENGSLQAAYELGSGKPFSARPVAYS